jgi:hypothetical protein
MMLVWRKGMQPPVDKTHFSAEVRIELRIEGKTHELAGVETRFCVPRHQLELPACNAEILMTVDGDVFMWPVTLPHGAVPFQREIPIAPRGEMQRLGSAMA